MKLIPVQSRVPPLTRRDSSGRIYRRTPEIELEIQTTLKASPDRWCLLATAGEGEPSRRMSSECLAHLMRALSRQQDDTMVRRLATPLLQRLTTAAHQFTRGLDKASGEDLVQDVVEAVTKRIFD